MTPPKQSYQKMPITLKKILHWNINHHALTMCVLYHHVVHFYENFKRRQKCTKLHNDTSTVVKYTFFNCDQKIRKYNCTALHKTNLVKIGQ